MLGDLVKIIEMLLKELRGIKSPERRRAHLSKELRSLYSNLNLVVEIGEQLEKLLRAGRRKSNSTVIDPFALEELLLKKQGVIEQVTNILNDETVNSVLKIHVPKLKKLQYVLTHKGMSVAFFLSQLTNMKRFRGADDVNHAFQEYDHHEWWGADPRRTIGAEGIKTAGGLEEYFGHYPSVVFATEAEISSFHKNVISIKRLAEELRQFLVSAFKVEELSE